MIHVNTHNIADSPGSDRDTGGSVETCLGDGSVVVGGSTFDIKFRDSNLDACTGQGSQCGLHPPGTTSLFWVENEHRVRDA